MDIISDPFLFFLYLMEYTFSVERDQIFVISMFRVKDVFSKLWFSRNPIEIGSSLHTLKKEYPKLFNSNNNVHDNLYVIKSENAPKADRYTYMKCVFETHYLFNDDLLTRIMTFKVISDENYFFSILRETMSDVELVNGEIVTHIPYVICENGMHLKDPGSKRCMHCEIAKSIEYSSITGYSNVDLLIGNNLYDRIKNLNLFLVALTAIKYSSNASSFFPNGRNEKIDIDFDCTEDDICDLVLRLQISEFKVYQSNELRINLNKTDEIDRIRIGHSKGIGPLVGTEKIIELEISDGQATVVKCSDIFY